MTSKGFAIPNIKYYVKNAEVITRIDGPSDDNESAKIQTGEMKPKYFFMNTDSTYPRNPNSPTKQGDPLADAYSFVQLEDGNYLLV